jgi:hypothetical protein
MMRATLAVAKGLEFASRRVNLVLVDVEVIATMARRNAI